MVNIVEKPEWKDVRVLETTELALGGTNGNMNEQARSLVARTEFLRKEKADIKLDNLEVLGNIELPEYSIYSNIKINNVPLKRPYNFRDYYFDKPKEFTWNANNHNFYLDKNGNLISDINPSDYDVASKSSSVVQYFVSPTGNDLATNTGTDPTTPLRSINGAIYRITKDSISNAVIWIQPARYSDAYTWSTDNPLSSNVSIKPWNSQATAPYLDTSKTPIIFPTDDTTLTWTLSTGSTYKTTRHGTHAVVDSSIKNKYGDNTFYQKKETLEECNSTPGSWFIDGTSLYLNTVDSRKPDSNINVFVTKRISGSSTGNYSLYLERVWFWGGDYSFFANIEAGSTVQQIFFNSCKFQYGSANGLQIRGATVTICYECEASYNRDDGFNYHAELGGTTRPTRVIEFKCKAYQNGQTWSPLLLSNQGSTTHDASWIVRAGTVCFDNGRQSFTDVGNSQSWMIHCQSRTTSAKPFEGSYFSDYQCAEGKMWLDHCDAKGHDYAVASTNNGKIYSRNSNLYPRIFQAQNLLVF